MFVDQHTAVGEMGKKIEPTVLDKVLKGKTKNNAKNICIYKGETETTFSRRMKAP